MAKMKTKADHLALAKRRVHRAADVVTPRKILIYARNKKGKTRFGLSGGISRTLVLDPEKGTATMKELNPYVWPINSWADLQEAYGALRTGELSPATLGMGPEKEPFSIVVPDGLTKMSNQALRYVMSQAEEKDLDRKPGMVQQRDYGKANELMKQMLQNFHALPMHVVYTAQERTITSGGFDDDEDSEDEGIMLVPDLSPGVRSAVLSIVDVIGRLYTIRDGDTIERRLQIGLHEKYDTGFRSDFALPSIVKDPTLPKLTELILNGEGEKAKKTKKKK